MRRENGQVSPDLSGGSRDGMYRKKDNAEREARNSGRAERPTKSYKASVEKGIGLSSPLQDVRHQLLLGDESFVEEYRGNTKPEDLREVSKAHRRSLAPALSEFQQK